MVRIRVTKNQKEELSTLALRARHAKADLDQAKEDYQKASEALVVALDAAGKASGRMQDLDGQRWRYQKVVQERLEVNEPGLRKALSAPVFDRLCDLKLNRQRLEMAIGEGQVDPTVVAMYTATKPTTPFVRFSAVHGREVADAEDEA